MNFQYVKYVIFVDIPSPANYYWWRDEQTGGNMKHIMLLKHCILLLMVSVCWAQDAAPPAGEVGTPEVPSSGPSTTTPNDGSEYEKLLRYRQLIDTAVYKIHSLPRSQSQKWVDWLSSVNDPLARSRMTALLKDRDSVVRDAARKSLDAMNIDKVPVLAENSGAESVEHANPETRSSALLTKGQRNALIEERKEYLAPKASTITRVPPLLAKDPSRVSRPPTRNRYRIDARSNSRTFVSWPSVQVTPD